jgi:tripartite-type tricarboxylate transporter receptor subunit TctC
MSLSHLVGGVLFNRHLVAEEFTPIMLTAQTTSIFAVHAALPVNSVAELIAYAKARPGEVNFGSAGNVTSMHLCMEMLRAATGVNVVHVPFKGASAMLTDLAGGRVQAACVPVAPVQPFIKSGRLRGLGVTSLTRTNLAPGLPPVAETVPGFEMNGWYGLVAPRGTPPAIVAKINGALARGLKSPAVVERLAGMGVEPVASSPAEFAAFLKAQTPKWRKLLQDANITAN